MKVRRSDEKHGTHLQGKVLRVALRDVSGDVFGALVCGIQLRYLASLS